MRNQTFYIILSILFLSLSSLIQALEKNSVNKTEANIQSIQELRVRPSISTADTCIARNDFDIYWQYSSWISGNELYKNFIDPSESCPNPYPYTVTEINMHLYFPGATTFTGSVDVETVDNTDPNCPSPGYILGLSSAWSFDIPAAGYYSLWVPLDTPVVVNEPFFAGFFIGDIDTLNIPYILTDSNTQAFCSSYNIWDTTIGFVDLMDYGFLGELILFATGIPGGGSSEPAPSISIVSPQNNSDASTTVELWADETSGSSIIDYVSFSYATDTNYIEIARDYDGTKSFRDGMNQVTSGDGFSYVWDFSLIPAGTYNIRVTAVDTLGRSASDVISLKLNPKPPIAEIVSPTLNSDFCPNLDFILNSDDNNLFVVNLGYKRSNPNYSVHAQTLLMSDFGSYYSSAITASLAIQAIQDQGIYNVMRLNSNPATPTQVANKFAEYFSIVNNSGVYDETVYDGLKQFNATVSYALNIEYIRYPTYLELRREIELLGKVGMLGLGGSSNNWLLLDGFYGMQALDGTYKLTVSNPETASIDTVQFRNVGNSSELYINGAWQPIEIMFLISTDGWNSQITNLGTDVNKSDGWAINWTPPNLWQGYDYFIQSKGTELTSLTGYYTTMLHYDCTNFYVAGDYDNDGLTDLDDLNILINYFTNQGSPPVGGDSRADANCDNYLNITDIVYYLNYLFGSAPQPCY